MRYPNPKPVTLPNGTDYMPDAFLRDNFTPEELELLVVGRPISASKP